MCLKWCVICFKFEYAQTKPADVCFHSGAKPFTKTKNTDFGERNSSQHTDKNRDIYMNMMWPERAESIQMWERETMKKGSGEHKIVTVNVLHVAMCTHSEHCLWIAKRENARTWMYRHNTNGKIQTTREITSRTQYSAIRRSCVSSSFRCCYIRWHGIWYLCTRVCRGNVQCDIPHNRTFNTMISTNRR